MPGGSSRVHVLSLTVLGFVALVDTSMISPIIASHARLLGADAFLAAVTAGLYSFIAVLATPVAGFLVDKLGRRKLLMCSLAADVAVMLGYAFSVSPAQLLAFRAAHAVADSFVLPSSLATIGDLFQTSPSRPLALYWSSVALAILVGSSASAALVARFGIRGVYLAVAGVVAAALALLSITRLKLAERYRPDPALRRPPLRRYAHRVLASSLTLLSLYLVIGFVVGTTPSLLIERVGLTEREAALRVATFMALSTTLSVPLILASSRALTGSSCYVLASTGLLASAASAIVLERGVASTGAWLAAAGIFSVALALSFMTSSYMSVTLPAEIRGTASGISQALGLLGVATGGPVTALLAATSAGITPAALLTAFCITASGILALLQRRER